VKLTIKLFAYFRDNRFVAEVMEFPESITVGEIADALQIDRDEIGITMINSKHCRFETNPAEGDNLAIFPVIGGG